MDNTGRSASNRGSASTNWHAPWNSAVGTQTMYCTDCHGSHNTSSSTSVVPSGSNPWGPHGSTNPFILKAPWTAAVGSDTDGLCFRCHSQSVYASNNSGNTGFNTDKGDGHAIHSKQNGKIDTQTKCRYCHVAVPHGWNNKALLVNLNDVGPEAVCIAADVSDGIACTLGNKHAAGTEVRRGGGTDPASGLKDRGYTNPPYYLGAFLKIRRFRSSDAWQQADCGSAGAGGNNDSGQSWMKDSNESCQNPN